MAAVSNIDKEVQNEWILGHSLAGVGFHMGERVRVVSGPDAGIMGLLISICSIEPEPLFHLETDDGGDRYVLQSEIAPV